MSSKVNSSALKEVVGLKKLHPEHKMVISRYLRQKEDGSFGQSLACLMSENEDGDIRVFGAFFGYSGGGCYDDGVFLIDHNSDEPVQVFVGSDIEDADISQDDKAVLAKVAEMLGDLREWDDDEDPKFSSAAEKLLKSGEDEDGDIVFMDPMFDGDALAEVSENWPILLRFED